LKGKPFLFNRFSFFMSALPAELQQQLDAIVVLCYKDCAQKSDPLMAVNAVTRQIQSLIQALIADVQRIVSANSDLQASPVPWVLLGRLVNHLNGHFQVRPRVMFGQEGEDAQATAEAVRGIGAAVRTLIETLSKEDELEQNLPTFRILTMEMEGDVEIAARFVFLDRISERVVAHKPAATQRWLVEVDGVAVRQQRTEDDKPSGSRDLPSPIRRYANPEDHEDEDACCAACTFPLFEFDELQVTTQRQPFQRPFSTLPPMRMAAVLSLQQALARLLQMP
jgi:hypothetical protein